MKLSAVITVSLWIFAGIIPLASSAQTPSAQGRIEGTLIFPSNVLPAQQVCATQVQTEEVFCVETQQSQSHYTLQVPSGVYQIFTMACTQIYPTQQSCIDGYDDKRAYYNAYVQCGLTYQCQQSVTINRPVSIDVLAGDTQQNINPHDWYTD